MKKITLSLIISLLIASNALAAPLMPNVADYRFISSQTNTTSKVFSGYGHGKIHDQAPNFNTKYFYEVEFDTPINCTNCRQ